LVIQVNLKRTDNVFPFGKLLLNGRTPFFR